MKIGILTLPLHTNYGGILQAWALQTILERMGHEVKVINLDRTPIKVGLLANIYLNLRRFFAHLRYGIFYCPRNINELQKQNYENYLIKAQYTQHFVDENIRNFYVSNYSRDIKPTDFDAIVVGSDQIWRPKYIKYTLKTSIENAFLGFAKSWNIKKFSYAASFGTDEWEYTKAQTVIVKDLIKKFKTVSVREHSGIKLCSEHLGVTAEQVLDPTMLLTKEDYINAFEIHKEPKSEGNLMVYILDQSDEKKIIVEQIAREKGLTSFMVGANNDGKIPLEERIQPRLQKWLRGFYDAEFIVTDSFHACVFSILFGKPFIAIGNTNRGLSRFESLLGMFDLQENLISKNIQYDNNKDYSIPLSVYKKWDFWRNKSMTYLINNLS